MIMAIFVALAVAISIYFLWATLKDSFFHRVWSVALVLLVTGISLLPQLWESWAASWLLLLIILVAILCITLSPFQRHIFARSAASTNPLEEILSQRSDNADWDQSRTLEY